MEKLLKAQPVADAIYARIASEAQQFQKKTKHLPTLATVLVGDNPASQVYVQKKGEMCVRLGLGRKDFKFSASTSEQDLIELVKKLNDDNAIDGILVQKPLPKQIRESAIFDLIDPTKDVDCFSPTNVGLLVQNRCQLKPCTPAGVMEIFSHYQLPIEGCNALIVGRSDIVGKPMSLLLLHANATITIAHSKTKDLPSLVSKADIVIAAIGKPSYLHANLPWQSHCVVIDVGINRTNDGKLVGDVEFEKVAPKVTAITPVPGGVGPMTIAMLMANTLRAAKLRIEGTQA